METKSMKSTKLKSGNLNYVKNEEFEHDLLKYIDVDYSDYDSINHDSQFPY